jgi:hypothetical protein
MSSLAKGLAGKFMDIALHNNNLVLPTLPNIFGNRCYHDKLSIKFYNKDSEKLPKPIQIALYHIKLWAKDNTSYLDNLETERRSSRSVRSERRESIACVLQCLVNHTDLCTMIPVKYNFGGGTSSLNAGLISTMTGISYKRVLRALDHLWECGYIKIKRQWAFRKDGLIARKLHILKVSKRVFDHLGIEKTFLAKTISYIRKQREIEPTLDSEFTDSEKLSRNVNNCAQKHKEEMKAKKLTGPQLLKNLMKKMSIRS